MKILSFFSILMFCIFWQKNFSLIFLVLPLFVICKEFFITKFELNKILISYSFRNNLKNIISGKISAIFYSIFGLFFGMILFFNLINLTKIEFFIYFFISPIFFLFLKYIFYNFFTNNPLNNFKISTIFAFFMTFLLSYFYIKNYDFTNKIDEILNQQGILVFENSYIEFLYNFIAKIDILKEFLISQISLITNKFVGKILLFCLKFMTYFGGFFAFGLILNFKIYYKKTFWFNFFLTILILAYCYFLIFVSKILSVDMRFLKPNQNIEICGFKAVKNSQILNLIFQNNEKILNELKIKISNQIDEEFAKKSKLIANDFLNNYYSFENDYVSGALYLKRIFKNEDKKQNYVENLWLKSVEKYIKNDFFIKVLNDNLITFQSDFKNCLSLNEISINFQNKALKNLSVSSIGGIISASSAKVASKIAIKAFTKFGLKIATKTGAKVASGVIAGGIAGSAVPGIGTAIGGIIGGVIGWVASDIVINEIDEKLNREKFEKEILKDLENYKNEIKNSINKSLEFEIKTVEIK